MTTGALTPAQAQALARFATMMVGAAFMEQGMGKSRIAIELANRRAHRIDALLWVAPYSVLGTVEAEASRWGLTVPARYIGYETLSQSDAAYLDVLTWARSRRIMLVADESTFIKNAWAKRHTRMRELRRHATYALALNGTPLTRDLWDIKRQMDWLHPNILDMSDRTFRERYFKRLEWTDDYGNERVWHKAYEPNIAHLQSLIAPYVIEARLDVGVPETTTVVVHTPGPAATKEYEKTRDDWLEQFAAFHDDLDFYQLLGTLARIVALDPERHRRIAEKVSGRSLVFCQYLEELHGIADCLEARPFIVTGETPPAERERTFEQFRTHDVPLLMTYGVGSYGLNLQAAHVVHLASQGWDYGRIAQAKSRVRRLGQEHAIAYYEHSTATPIEALISRNLTKKNVLDMLLRNELSHTDL